MATRKVIRIIPIKKYYSYGIILYDNVKKKWLLVQHPHSYGYHYILRGRCTENDFDRCISRLSKKEIEKIKTDITEREKNLGYSSSMLQYLNRKIEKEEGLEEVLWGFPKGRKKLRETVYQAATREFKEETGINLEQIKILDQVASVHYMGSIINQYNITCYVAIVDQEITLGDKYDKREISQRKWMDYDEAEKRLVPDQLPLLQQARDIVNILK